MYVADAIGTAQFVGSQELPWKFDFWQAKERRTLTSTLFWVLGIA